MFQMLRVSGYTVLAMHDSVTFLNCFDPCMHE